MPKYRDENGRYIPTMGLSKQQIEAIHLIVYEGKRGKEVHEAVGTPASTYYDWYKQDLFMEELEKERKVMRRQFKNKAWKRLGDVLENASYRDVMPAIRMVLEDDESNFYLNNKLDINQNTTENITITLFNGDNEEE